MNSITKIKCQYCGKLREIDFESIGFSQDSILYQIEKFGRACLECDACKKAMQFQKSTGGRTSKCQFCDGVANYSADENFIKCFCCGKGVLK